MENIKECIWIKQDKKKCGKQVMDGHVCCQTHREFYDYQNEKHPDGYKRCWNGKRGCKKVFENKEFITRGKIVGNFCSTCRDKINSSERKYRKEMSEKIVEKGKQRCTTCSYEGNIDEFKNGDQILKSCLKCREHNKKQDKRRSGRKRDWKQELLNNPLRKLKKDLWKLMNYEKCSMYWRKYRQRKINEIGVQEWRDHCYGVKKLWLEKNPNYIIDYNQIYKNSLNYNLHKYDCEINQKEIPCELTENDFVELFLSNCFYCNKKAKFDKHNGVDRFDNTLGYTKDNSVSCCTKCNMMKHCLRGDIFIGLCEHICIFNSFIDGGELHNNLFADYIAQNEKSKKYLYTKYLCSAKHREKHFELSKEEFEVIIKQPCYICGKDNDKNHQNGLDRFNNNIGYTIENCRSCCGCCNYMKGELDYDDFLNHCFKIYINCQNIIDNEDFSNINNNDKTHIQKSEFKVLSKEEKENIKEKKKKRKK